MEIKDRVLVIEDDKSIRNFMNICENFSLRDKKMDMVKEPLKMPLQMKR